MWQKCGSSQIVMSSESEMFPPKTGELKVSAWFGAIRRPWELEEVGPESEVFCGGIILVYIVKICHTDWLNKMLTTNS